MKKFLLFVLLLAICFVGCTSTSAENGGEQSAGETMPAVSTAGISSSDFSDALGKEWKLTSVLIGGKDSNFDRNVLLKDFGDIFTLTFDAERLSGVAAPNRYFAPYTLGTGNEIKVGHAAGTLMAAFREPDKLKEYDFLTYIQNSYQWSLTGSNLELLSKTSDGIEVVLILCSN